MSATSSIINRWHKKKNSRRNVSLYMKIVFIRAEAINEAIRKDFKL
jgi:hypothetical protein